MVAILRVWSGYVDQDLGEVTTYQWELARNSYAMVVCGRSTSAGRFGKGGVDAEVVYGEGKIKWSGWGCRRLGIQRFRIVRSLEGSEMRGMEEEGSE